MKEGWYNDDYLILFEGSEAEDKERDYEIDRLLPGHRLLGMVGWDYFLVMNRENQRVFRVPTIPLILKEKEEWPHKVDLAALKPDERFQGKVKWYLKPCWGGNKRRLLGEQKETGYLPSRKGRDASPAGPRFEEAGA